MQQTWTSAKGLLCVQETHCRERKQKRKSETSAAVQGAMVETWEYAEEVYVFAFGEAVIAAVQRPETHVLH